ncbi:MAG: Holliday junction branch migration DNA helicase RuvB [Parvularculaceae bacterium]
MISLVSRRPRITCAFSCAGCESTRRSARSCALQGPPGLGKTTLAQIVANELGVNFRSTSGPVITKPGDLAAILTNLEAGDVLFIDEIHRLTPAVEEVLYPAMEDFALDLMIGEGPSARSVKIDLPRFTLVGATTRSGLLAKPLLDRFGIPVRLDFYSHTELSAIAAAQASSTPPCPMTAPWKSRAARAARRALREGCSGVRDVATVEGRRSSPRSRRQGVEALEIDALGLDPLDRRYLRLIAEHFGGGPVGVENDCGGPRGARDAVEDVVEPFLLQQGLIQRTPRGRLLSASA